MKNSLRAILFDFDGVLADTEPVHFAMFQKVFQDENIPLTREEYYEKYLGLDDRACFDRVFRDRGLPLERAKNEALVRKKNQALLEFIRDQSLLRPGVREFVDKMGGKFYTAVVSGALRSEIATILNRGGIMERLQVIVAADDVLEGKPSPEGFLKGIRLLNRDFVQPAEILLPRECLAIEDSPWGIEAAHRAGAKCLAILSSYPAGRLKDADMIVPDFSAISWPALEGLFPRQQG